MFPTTPYKNIADNISNIYGKGATIVSLIDSMIANLQNSEVDDDNIDKTWLLNSLDMTKDELIKRHNTKTRELINFVNVFQNETVRGVDNINTFLLNRDIQVSSTFADLSSDVGHPINSEHIEN